MLSNLALLCRRHHRAVHEEGYQVERQPDGGLTFRHPNGYAIPYVPSAWIPDNPVEIIRGRNKIEGLKLDAHTTTPGWHGERLDVGHAMDVLHPRAKNG